MCAACNAGDAAFAVHYVSRNAIAGDEDDNMSRVPDGEPLCTCSRFYLMTRTSPPRVRYCVARARTIKIRKPIIPIDVVCIPARMQTEISQRSKCMSNRVLFETNIKFYFLMHHTLLIKILDIKY